MAFETKYTLRKKNPATLTVWRAHIQFDGGPFSPVEFDIAAVPFTLNYRCNSRDPDWLYAPSILTLRFVDTPAGLLTELQNGTDRSHKVILTYQPDAGVETTFWTGFIDPDSYSTNLYGKGVAGVQAVDQLRTLNESAFDNAGVLYTGQETVVNMLAQALEPTGLGIGLQTHSYKYSYLASNPLTTSLDPLAHHTWDQGVYVDGAEDPNALSCIDVIKDICEGWELQLFQSDGRWCIYERNKDVTGAPPHRFTVWNYDADGTPAGSDSQNARLGISLNSTISHKFEKYATLDAERPIGKASVVYKHGRLDDLFLNQGFETAFAGNWTTTGGVGTDNRARTGSFALDTGADYQLEPRTSGLLQYAEQTTAAQIGGATGYTFRLKFRIKMPDFNELGGHDAYAYYNFEIDGDSYYDETTNSWVAVGVLSEVAKAQEIPISSFLTDTDYLEYIVLTPVLNGLSGPARVRLWNLVEVDPGSGSQTQNSFLWDDLEIELLDTTGQQIRLARRTTLSVNGSENLRIRQERTILHGTGPLTAFKGAIRALDSTFTDAGLAEHFARGVPGATTGDGFERIYGESKIRQFRDPARVVRGTVINYGSIEAIEIRPHNPVTIERADVATEDEYFWFEEYEYAPANPEALIKTSYCQINQGVDPDVYAVENIDEAAGLNGSGGVESFTSVVSIIATGGGDGGLPVLEDETELQATVVGTEETAALVQWIGTNSGVGGGIFVGDPDDVATPADAGTVFVDPAGTRWKRLDVDGYWRTEWFGAVWDGVTDDSAAIQACVDAARPGATIVLPAKKTILNTRILIDGKPLTFRGESPSYYKDDGRTDYPTNPAGTFLQSGPSLTGAQFGVQDTVSTAGKVSGTRFEHIHFAGNKDGNATDTHAVEFVRATKGGMYNCTVSGFTSHGVDTTDPAGGDSTGCEELEFIACTFAENDGIGLQLLGNNCIVRGCVALDNGSHGFFENLFSSGGNLFTGCQSNGNEGIGFYLTANVGDTQVIGCNAQNNAGRGFEFGAELLATPINYVVSGCISIGNGTDAALTPRQRSGFSVTQVKNISFIGCLAADNGGYGLNLNGDYTGHFDGLVGSGNTSGLLNTQVQTVGPLGTYNAVHEGLLQFANPASARITTLLAKVPAGGVIVFPPGEYVIDAQVLIVNPITIKGWATNEENGTAGGTVFKIGAGFDDPMLDTSFVAAGLRFEDIHFVGIGDASPGTDVTAVRVFAEKVSFNRCTFDNFNGYGLEVSSNKATLNRCKFSRNLLGGVRIIGDEIAVNLCRYDDNEGPAIDVQGGSNIVISNSKLDNNHTGINVNGADRVAIRSTAIDNCTTGAGVSISDSDRSSVHDCTLDGNPIGIDLPEGTNTSIQTNDISNSGTYAIQTGAALGSAIILNNTGAGNGTAYYNLDATTAGDIIIDLEVTVTLDFASISAGQVGTPLNVSINGARPGDAVKLGPPATLEAGLIGFGVVTANDTVEVRLFNGTAGAINPASADWNVHIERRSPALSIPVDPPPAGFDVNIVIDNRNLLDYA